jgi:hypothetical protein
LVEQINREIQELSNKHRYRYFDISKSESYHSNFLEHFEGFRKKGDNLRNNQFIEHKTYRNGNHGDCNSSSISCKQGNEDTLVRISCTYLL